MKKFLLVPSLLALLVVGVAHAQTTEEELPEPGMTPANPFYFLDEFGRAGLVDLLHPVQHELVCAFDTRNLGADPPPPGVGLAC